MIAAFVHIEKTGGTSLIETIRQSTMLGHCDIIPQSKTAEIASPSDFEYASRLHPGLRSLAGHSIRPHCDFGRLQDEISLYTILRPGVARFLSDFNHDRVKRGFSGSFSEWSEFEDRRNFQVRAISGSEDLDHAKEVLRREFSVVGVTEFYDVFQSQVAELLHSLAIDVTPMKLNTAGTRRGSIVQQNTDGIRVLRREDLTIGELALAEEKNRLDQSLYDFAKSELIPASVTSIMQSRFERREWRRKANRMFGRIWRNAVYKPAVGHLPFSVHTLPRNAVNSQVWYEGSQTVERDP